MKSIEKLDLNVCAGNVRTADQFMRVVHKINETIAAVNALLADAHEGDHAAEVRGTTTNTNEISSKLVCHCFCHAPVFPGDKRDNIPCSECGNEHLVKTFGGKGVRRILENLKPQQHTPSDPTTNKAGR